LTQWPQAHCRLHRCRARLEVAHIKQGLFGAHRWHVTFAHVQQVGRTHEQRVGAGQRQPRLLVGLQHELRAEKTVVARGAQLHRSQAANAEVAHQPRDQRQFAVLALNGERRLQHDAQGVVFLAVVFLGKTAHGLGVFGLQAGVAKGDDGGFVGHEVGGGANANARTHGFGHLIVTQIQRGVADRR
jgi:hypothetical protein